MYFPTVRERGRDGQAGPIMLGQLHNNAGEVTRMIVLLTGNSHLLFNLPDVGLSLSRQIGELTTMFSAALPARHTAVVHRDVSKLLLAGWTHTDRHTDRETHRHTGRQTQNHRHTERLTEMYREADRERQTDTERQAGSRHGSRRAMLCTYA